MKEVSQDRQVPYCDILAKYNPDMDRFWKVSKEADSADVCGECWSRFDGPVEDDDLGMS